MKAACDGMTHAVNVVMGDAATMAGTTKALVEAARTNGLTRIIEFSSTAVFTDTLGYVPASAPFGAGGDAYARAKQECERILAATDPSIETVILRPGLIYGIGAEQWTMRIARLLRQRRLGDLGPMGDGYANLIHVDDVGSAVIGALRLPGLSGCAFNLADPDPVRWNAYLMSFARALGYVPIHRVGHRQMKLEKLAAIPLKIAEKLAAKARLRLPIPDAITPGFARLFSQDVRYGDAKTFTTLDVDLTPLHVGLQQCAEDIIQKIARRV